MATVTIRDVAWKLARGGHVPTDCQACLLEITALKAEEEFSDRPVCVSPVLAGFGRTLWDSTPQDAPLAELVPFADRLVGTSGRPDLDQKAGLMAADWSIRRFPGPWLRLAGLDEYADALAALPELTSWVLVELSEATTDAAAAAAAAAAQDAARVAAQDTAAAAARVAAWTAARVAAQDAAAAAAWVAAWTAAQDAAQDAAAVAARVAAWTAAQDAAQDAAAAAARVAA